MLSKNNVIGLPFSNMSFVIKVSLGICSRQPHKSIYVFHFNNRNYLCVIDYNSKFPIIKRLEGLSADNLINTVKIIFTEYGIPWKILSDAGTNFVSDRLWQFCKTFNIEQAVSLVYHHQSNGQVEACIKFIKCTFKKCTNSGRDISMALLQICTMPLGPGLPSLATLMLNRQVWGIMPVLRLQTCWTGQWWWSSQQAGRQAVQKWQWHLTSIYIYSHRVSCSNPVRRQWAVDPWEDSWHWQP